MVIRRGLRVPAGRYCQQLLPVLVHRRAEILQGLPVEELQDVHHVVKVVALGDVQLGTDKKHKPIRRQRR